MGEAVINLLSAADLKFESPRLALEKHSAACFIIEGPTVKYGPGSAQKSNDFYFHSLKHPIMIPLLCPHEPVGLAGAVCS